MLAFTSAQLDAWIAALMFPLARVFGLIATAPVFSNAALPRRARLMFGLAITFALIPLLPPVPEVQPGSGIGLAVMAQQILIGAVMGFAMRLVFAAVDLAGEMIGLQMGLSFAVFYDPETSGQSAAIAEFLGLLVTLIFLSLDGHLVVISLLAKSFVVVPIGAAPAAGVALETLVRWGAIVFSAGVLIALPLVAALLITNIALGIITRAAPQLNIFAVGFPVTMVVGFGVLMLALPYLAPVFQRMFENGFDMMTRVLQAPGVGP